MIATTRVTEPQGVVAMTGEGVTQSAINEYFGLWCVEPTRFRHVAETCNGMDLTVHLSSYRELKAAESDGRSGRMYSTTRGGVALVQLRGTMMKFTSSLTGGASTVFARRAIRQAVQDTEVRSIMLVLDSPGGTVSGTMDLAEDVRSAATKKPIHAFFG
ncbi:MAG: Clp protease/crotonase-like domain-containing protein [Pirellulaceae bacterium]